MIDLTLTDRVVIPDAVVSRELEGETVVLNLETGIYFGLDEVATEIWKALQSGGSLQEACDALHGAYDVDPLVLRDDLLHLVNQMAAKGLVQAAS
ncbi:MAG: Coenzyme synthesis protein (PqqD) [Acidobacteria bacterium]|nr:Coenzyme synthesis protein (PqqD) [Acidobacteriota bacterium]